MRAGHQSSAGLDAVRSRLADAMAPHLPLQLGHRQQVLEIADVRKRLLYLNSATETPR